MSPIVAIIIVNWNGKADTLECLRSLEADGYPSKRIIVVDNASSDDSRLAINAAFSGVELVLANSNLGFTGGNNIGIKQALDQGVDYLFFLNNDTTVEVGAISALIAAADSNPNAGLLTPVIHYFDKPEELWFAGSEMDLSLGKAVHSNSVPPLRSESPRPIPWASGCAMLMPARVVRQLGGFDDRFFLNWEDVDLSLRVRAAGYEILLVPEARIFHKVSRSFAQIFGISGYYHVRNQLLLIQLHLKRGRIRAYSKILTMRFLDVTRAILRREPHCLDSFSIVLRGVCDFMCGRLGAISANAFDSLR